MFRTEFRTELAEDVYDPTGASVIADCLDIRTKKAYQQQADKFDLRIAELLKLKADHKFTHRAEKKALKEECEQLMAYRETFRALESSGVYMNIPLIEENAKELEIVAEKMREAVKAQAIETEKEEDSEVLEK